MQIIAILMLVLSFLQGGEESYTIVAINNAHSVTVKRNQLLNVNMNIIKRLIAMILLKWVTLW